MGLGRAGDRALGIIAVRLAVLATVALLSLAGCASQPDYFFIVPNVKDIVTSQDPASAYRDAITAAPVSGGKDVSILSIPYISNADFQESLVRTLHTLYGLDQA